MYVCYVLEVMSIRGLGMCPRISHVLPFESSESYLLFAVSQGQAPSPNEVPLCVSSLICHLRSRVPMRSCAKCLVSHLLARVSQ